MNLQQQARHLNSIINLHQNLLREARYSNSIAIPLPRDDGGGIVRIRSPHDLERLPYGTRINLCGDEVRIDSHGVAWKYSEEADFTFDEFWDALVELLAYPPEDHPEALPYITHMPITERN